MFEAAKALTYATNQPVKRQFIAKAMRRGYYHIDGVPDEVCGEIILIKRLAWTLTDPGGLDWWDYMDLKDPMSVAYAATPLSFVLDYVTPIGAFLKAKRYADTLIGTGVLTTYIKGRAKTLSFAGRESWLKSLSGVPYTRADAFVLRTPLSALDVPLPTVNTYQSIPSWKRALTAVGLLGQALL
jgi:hypothetical protein